MDFYLNVAVWTFHQIGLTLWGQDRKSTFKFHLQQCKFFCHLFDLAVTPQPHPKFSTSLSHRRHNSIKGSIPKQTWGNTLSFIFRPWAKEIAKRGRWMSEISNQIARRKLVHYALFGIMIPLSSSMSDKKYNCSSDSHKGMYKINM